MLKKFRKCDDGTEIYSTTGVPEMFPTVEHRWAKCIDAYR